jgi:hypothetical protein
MSEAVETKRQNFNVTPEQEAQIEHLRDVLGASSAKDAILRAVFLTVKLREYLNKGYHIELIKDDKRSGLLIPDLEPSVSRDWQYLVERPHSWRRQLYQNQGLRGVLSIDLHIVVAEIAAPSQTCAFTSANGNLDNHCFRQL